MRPPSGDEEVPAPKQVKEKKRKDVPSSPISEKKQQMKKSRKPKGDSGVMPSESIRRLRDELEEGEEELACVWANVVIQQSSESAEVNKGTLAIIPEQGKDETIPSRAEMVEGETKGRTSRVAEDISRDEIEIIDISGSSQILDAMIREASMLEGRSYKGIQESTDIHDFLDGLESAASKEIIGFGVLSITKKASWSEEHEAEIRNLTEKSDSYKLLSEKLRADLAATLDEHEDMADQVDELMAEEEKFKQNMDILASKKESVQAQLESAENQLQAAKENASVHIERVKELQRRLDLAASNKESLANELEVDRSEVVVARSEVAVAKSEVTEANKRADAKVTQFRIDVEVNRDKTKSMVEYAK
ncbi:uncharacterized protein [Nicotiana tomentosiformis]|uniref:uncharacterized protein n=1 Tax=Nicotiana tomentosiformis TaxID=4098 RepID=UPI00388C7702